MGKRPANPSHDEKVLDDWLRQDGTYELVPNNYGTAPFRSRYPELIKIPRKMWRIAEKLGEWKQCDDDFVSENPDAHWPGGEHNMGNVAELMARAMLYKAMDDKDWGWEPIYNPGYFTPEDGYILPGARRASVDEGGNPDWDLRIGPPDNSWRMEVKATGWGSTDKWVLRVKASEYKPHHRLHALCTMMVGPYCAKDLYPEYMLPFHWVSSSAIDQVPVTKKGDLAPKAPCRILPFSGFTTEKVDAQTHIGPTLQPVTAEQLRQWAVG